MSSTWEKRIWKSTTARHGKHTPNVFFSFFFCTSNSTAFLSLVFLYRRSCRQLGCFLLKQVRKCSGIVYITSIQYIHFTCLIRGVDVHSMKTLHTFSCIQDIQNSLHAPR
ncbi:hypothetical protein FB567DRAFT_125838 [Paraphoma chrysanthemicola]|uniref:Uncharacterized protein n=1 Tax=Paraphoma chrysanthemicola TaxID=798071 RepID=A0A8K0QZ29_9PLEO|nr:hypothetical protein FB567DRAFT_125838 [Paraphoma chrysanthemicola]